MRWVGMWRREGGAKWSRVQWSGEKIKEAGV